MDNCPGCNADPCTCGGDLSPDAPGAAEAATPETEAPVEGGDLGL